ncbi:DUF485 domain-containing protein [Streptomyces sp. NPDC089424]|uniref:DUF485 domain-containing protein n=1 Tax=Streptomyces sp. NPDC089424 TaxID=3365917 RepID=UPI0038087286
MSHDPYPPPPRRPSYPPPPHRPSYPPSGGDPYPPRFPGLPPTASTPPLTSRTHPTYPWQPEARPEPDRRPTPVHAPLGHHSDLRILRSAYRWQRRVATLTALGYFTLFLVLSAAAPGFMTAGAAGGLPTGLLLALVQLPVTWLAIALYERTARVRVDPLADRIRRQAALDAKRGAGR